MGSSLLASLALLSLQGPDTTTYSTTATRELIARAMVRHQVQDTAVRDYRARIRYRLSFGLGRRRWANVPNAAVEEVEGKVAWQLPNELRIDLLGTRQKTRNPEWKLDSDFDQPWFVPRGLNDSVRVFGADFPERAALHPLAGDGPEWYHYAIEDSVAITTPGVRPIRLLAIRLTPKRKAPSLIAGRMWLDADNAEVVRLAFRYVGSDIWVAPEGPTGKDSSSARRANRLINRIFFLDADLEYALQEGRYWMPYRQMISGKVQIPFIGDYVIPFQTVTGFSDYEINTGERIVFELPSPDSSYRGTVEGRRDHYDSLNTSRRDRYRHRRDSTGARIHASYVPGGRAEIHRPARDSLRAYRDWGDSLALDLTDQDDLRVREVQQDLARMVEGLSSDITGLHTSGFGYERLADIFRFNRVQGASLGFGYQVAVKPLSFTTAYGTARFGTSDRRLTGRLALVRDAPGGKWTLAAYHDLLDADPFSRGLSFGNSVRAVFSTRDEADYYLATGASLSYETSLDRGVDFGMGLRGERHRSVSTRASAPVPSLFGDGSFKANPPVDEGNYGIGWVRLDGSAWRSRWSVTVDGVTGDGRSMARVYGQLRQPIGGRRGLTMRLQGGLATRPLLTQFEFRAGGQSMVRGFDYGTQQGQAFWSAQLDLSPWRRAVRPVLFVDAGQAGALSALGEVPLMVGGGAGLSALAGLVRLDVSHRISSHASYDARGGWRVDLVFGGAR